MLADNSPVMEQTNKTIDAMFQNPKERRLYKNRMKYKHDKASWGHFGYTKGVQAGITEGITQGARQKALETARLMRVEKLGVDLISKVTGLSEAEIAKL
ncbi:hypothetical protein H0R92_13740 [Treponema sp. OMZ 840]